VRSRLVRAPARGACPGFRRQWWVSLLSSLGFGALQATACLRLVSCIDVRFSTHCSFLVGFAKLHQRFFDRYDVASTVTQFAMAAIFYAAPAVLTKPQPELDELCMPFRSLIRELSHRIGFLITYEI